MPVETLSQLGEWIVSSLQQTDLEAEQTRLDTEIKSVLIHGRRIGDAAVARLGATRYLADVESAVEHLCQHYGLVAVIEDGNVGLVYRFTLITRETEPQP